MGKGGKEQLLYILDKTKFYMRHCAYLEKKKRNMYVDKDIKERIININERIG
jgi:hypothetical protein